MSSSDDVYMKRCLELAKKGLGQVSPNPMVGAVIVYNDKIIGEGYHQNYGGPHAEVNAIKSLKDMSLLKDSTIYVNLEPCSFIGKTPACAELLQEKQFNRVVIGCKDPNPKVSGKGIEIIKNSGINTECGVLEIECINLNKRFFINQNEQRPFIILKFAQTSDAFIARSDYSSKWISGPQSRAMVHQWRSEEDAIMIGTNTAMYDDPSLTVRLCSGRNPVRLILDRTLRLPDKLKVFNDQEAKTIIIHDKNIAPDKKNNLNYHPVDFKDNNCLEILFNALYIQGIGSIIIEGGSLLLNNINKKGLWDEARVFTSKAMFKDGIKAPILQNNSNIISTEYIQDDRLDIIKRI